MPDVQVPIAHRRAPRDTSQLRSADATVAGDYFARGPFRKEGPLAFRTYTCLGCGHRSPEWPLFRRHRQACINRLHGASPAVVARLQGLDPELEALKAAALLEEEQEDAA